jgi:hypothetical protein
LDQEIAKLREAHKANVAKLQFERRSAKTLKRITDELLPKLTAGDLLFLSKDIAAKIQTKPTTGEK